MEWVLIKERLPEIDGIYLVTFKGGRHADTCWFLNGRFSIYGEKKTNFILAWMPLPEQYEEYNEKIG